jgi:hypothetical protein
MLCYGCVCYHSIVILAGFCIACSCRCVCLLLQDLVQSKLWRDLFNKLNSLAQIRYSVGARREGDSHCRAGESTPRHHPHSVGARREGDAHCRAGESTPVDKGCARAGEATRVARRARRRASRLTPCGWRERPPSSRSVMARTKWCHKTAAEKAAALAVAQRDAQCATARRAKRTSRMIRSEFTRMFRMDPPTFAYLVGALSPRIDRNFVQTERTGGYIRPELRVAMTIRWRAGGSYLALKERAPEFGLRQRPHMRAFRGVVGASDGLLVKILCPWKSEVGMPRTFFCRKGVLTLSVQTVCDARERFIFVSMDIPGSTHDARAFTMSALWEAIELGYISQGFYLLGDTIYRGIQHILTPFIGNQTGDETTLARALPLAVTLARG